MSNINFKCGLCLEQKSEPPVQVRIIHGSMVCPECTRDNIMPLFRAALAHEHHYPPQWGKKEMKFDDFKHFLTSAEQDEWEVKIEEYKTPVPTRIYCKHKLQASTTDDGTVTSAGDCNNFMGSTTLQGGISQCNKCEGWTCRLCGGPYEVPADQENDDDRMEIDHICKEKEPDLLQDSSLEDRYQRCPEPTCGFIISLHDGCNAMDCERCGTIFCYLCGEITTHESNHWTYGSSECPRWHEPGDENAEFDPPAADPIDLADLAPRDPLGPLERVPDDQVLDAFRVTRDQMRGYGVHDDGHEARERPTPDHSLELENDLNDIMITFTDELEETYGSVDGAPEALREMHNLLHFLDDNLTHIYQVEGRFEIFHPGIPRPTDAFERVAAAMWYEETHEFLEAYFLPMFFEAIKHVVVGSVLLGFDHDSLGDFRAQEIFEEYLAWDMSEFIAGALDVHLHHQRRHDRARDELREQARQNAGERALRLREQEGEQDVD